MTHGGPREQLVQLLRNNAVLRGSFTLASGQQSSFYLDARLVTLSALGSRLVGQVFHAALNGFDVQAVAGLTLGADPIVSAVAVVSSETERPIDGLIVRKERKAHGGKRRIEGPWPASGRVAVVEDTVTTGSSALEAARAIEECGGSVACVLGLIDREQGASEAISGAGYRFTAIYSHRELLS